jgi:ubiquinone/menaquinone biosynthesis C-methylase UbiE
MNQISGHFDKIAKDYDYYKAKKWYYYDNLKKIYKNLIPPQKKVLDVGCGTGDLLANLEPSYGLGIDISQEMIKIAQLKHKNRPNIKFLVGTIGQLISSNFFQKFEYIYMADVIEHLEDVSSVVKSVNRIADSDTKIIISMANPLWEPILFILEKLKLKMAEGPHKRIPVKELESILSKNNFKIIEKDYRLILPAFIPFLSDFINRYFYRIPLLRNLGLVFFIKFSKNA